MATTLAALPVRAQERPPSAPPQEASAAKPKAQAEGPVRGAAPQPADTLPVSIAQRPREVEDEAVDCRAAPQGGLFGANRGAASVAGDVRRAALGDVAAGPVAPVRTQRRELSASAQLRVSGGVRCRSREPDRVGEGSVQCPRGPRRGAPDNHRVPRGPAERRRRASRSAPTRHAEAARCLSYGVSGYSRTLQRYVPPHALRLPGSRSSLKATLPAL